MKGNKQRDYMRGKRDDLGGGEHGKNLTSDK